MKKMFLILLACIFTVGLVGCGGDHEQPANEAQPPQQAPKEA